MSIILTCQSIDMGNEDTVTTVTKQLLNHYVPLQTAYTSTPVELFITIACSNYRAISMRLLV